MCVPTDLTDILYQSDREYSAAMRGQKNELVFERA